MNVLSSLRYAPWGILRRRVTFAAALALVTDATAQSLVFSSFSSTTGLTLNSLSATTTGDGTVLHIADNSSNDRGSVFSTAMRTVSGFSTAFQFRLSTRGGSSDGTHTGADGIVFVIQRTGNTSLGTNGQGLGYSGIGLSLGVEFDTYNNSGSPVFDPNSNHVGIDSLGSVVSLMTQAVTPDFDDGNLWTAWIDYDGTTLQVRVNETGIRPGSALLSYPLTLSATLDGTSAYVGFTASTGAAWADHDLIKWTFSDSYIPGGVTPGIAIPEPADFALIASAIALVGVAIQRKRAKRSVTA